MSGMRTLKLSVPRARHPLHPHDVITCPCWFGQQGPERTRSSCRGDGGVGGTHPETKSGGKELGSPKKLLGRLPQQLKFRACLHARRGKGSERWPPEQGNASRGRRAALPRSCFPDSLLQKGNCRLVTASLRTGDYRA